jgi:hypothetical protein
MGIVGCQLLLTALSVSLRRLFASGPPAACVTYDMGISHSLTARFGDRLWKLFLLAATGKVGTLVSPYWTMSLALRNARTAVMALRT